MYREVTMFEVTEALRLWLSGTPKKRIAAQVGLDPKTVRHYVAVGAGIGLQLGAVLTEEHIRDVLLALQPSGGRPRGDTWSQCVAQREAIERGAAGRAAEQDPQAARADGVAIHYPTLHRFAVLELPVRHERRNHAGAKRSICSSRAVPMPIGSGLIAGRSSFVGSWPGSSARTHQRSKRQRAARVGISVGGG